ncbi:MAG TPA: histidine phosphatase family protein [Sphingorhabdus sp.]|nr:histidine phosphatase family protein [Sphingorhabdus sp.]
MTLTLILFRHAKSSWDDAIPRDFDRPLNKRGEKAAVLVGKWVKENGIAFDHVVASPAVRVIDTIDQFVKGTGERIDPTWDRRIYLASSATLMDVLRDQADEHEAVMMVGHNPGMEDLVFDLVPDDGSSPLRDVVWEKYPTGSLARMELAIGHWADIDRKCGRLTHFIRPRDLDPELGPEEE